MILAFETKTRAQEGNKGCYQLLPQFQSPQGICWAEGLLSMAQEPLGGSSLPLLQIWPVEGAASPHSHSSLGFAT